MTTSPISPSTLISSLRWRYATKQFDPTKTIAPDLWETLEETLVLTPSSCGLQPWKFIVITDKDMKAKLRPHSWNQSQVTDCSHYVVFASQKKIDEAYVDRFLAITAEIRGIPVESLAGFRGMIIGTIVQGPINQQQWAGNQAYIALGNFMTAAALLGVDTCPMEGFIPAEYDKILGLEEKGLSATVCCAAGYRSEEDKYAKLAKIRFCKEEVIRHI